jgi:Holliday junction resolvasome RuvABC endonuclease subunit
MGLDLSLRCSGVVILGSKFSAESIDFDQIYSTTVGFVLEKGTSTRGKIRRLQLISEKICNIVKEFSVRYVMIEDYAYSMIGKTFDLAELGGVIKSDLLSRLHVVPCTCTATEARRNLIGAPKKKNPKKQVADFLVDRGILFKTFDENDAFAVAVLQHDRLYGENGSPSFRCYWDDDTRKTYDNASKRKKYKRKKGKK